MQRFCLALDLKDDPELIAAYEAHHREVWPEILASIREAGILDMKIYRTGNRLFMLMETNDAFTFEAKAAKDSTDQYVADWEALMWKYQQALPHATPGEKWVLMKKIFDLHS